MHLLSLTSIASIFVIHIGIALPSRPTFFILDLLRGQWDQWARGVQMGLRRSNITQKKNFSYCKITLKRVKCEFHKYNIIFTHE